MLVFLTNAAGPERVFSAMNWIKNEKRNRLSDLTLADILMIRLNRVEPSDMDYAAVVQALDEALPSSD